MTAGAPLGDRSLPIEPPGRTVALLRLTDAAPDPADHLGRLRADGVSLTVVLDQRTTDASADPAATDDDVWWLPLDPATGTEALLAIGRGLAAGARASATWLAGPPGAWTLDAAGAPGTGATASTLPASALLPDVPTHAAYLASVEAGTPWVPVVDAVCRLAGIEPAGAPWSVSSHAHPTFIVPPDHVLKLYAPWEDGPAMVAAERAAFDWLRRDPDLPVPSLVASGPLAPDHAYLLMTRLPGRPLDELRPELSLGALVPLLAWCGRVLRRIHAIELSPQERLDGREAFLGFTWEMRRTAVADPVGLLGLPEHLAAQLDAWLPDEQTLTGPVEGLAVIHGDLQYRHLMVERDGDGTLRPTGVIDLNRMRIGRPILDLGPLWGDLGPEPGTVRDAFLAAAAIPGPTTADARRDALAWALLQRRRRTYLVPGHDRATTLDELADLVFRGIPAGTP